MPVAAVVPRAGAGANAGAPVSSHTLAAAAAVAIGTAAGSGSGSGAGAGGLNPAVNVLHMSVLAFVSWYVKVSFGPEDLPAWDPVVAALMTQGKVRVNDLVAMAHDDPIFTTNPLAKIVWLWVKDVIAGEVSQDATAAKRRRTEA